MTENYLTHVEHELMEILWRIGEGTVRDVMEHLPSNRNLAYTSVSTILRILQQKNILTVKKIGRQHIYVPTLTQTLFTTQSVKKIVKQVFSGNSVNLVAHLVNQHSLSNDEINAIQQLLDEKKRNS